MIIPTPTFETGLQSIAPSSLSGKHGSYFVEVFYSANCSAARMIRSIAGSQGRGSAPNGPDLPAGRVGRRIDFAEDNDGHSLFIDD